VVSQDLLAILRCPYCVNPILNPARANDPDRQSVGLLDLERDGTWLVCRDCARKYPIRDDIPVMLIDEGDKYINVALADLPNP